MASCSLAQKNYSTAVCIDQDKLNEFSAQQTDKLFENMKQSGCTSGVRTHSGLFFVSVLELGPSRTLLLLTIFTDYSPQSFVFAF
jgi:hypothetical protein